MSKKVNTLCHTMSGVMGWALHYWNKEERKMQVSHRDCTRLTDYELRKRGI